MFVTCTKKFINWINWCALIRCKTSLLISMGHLTRHVSARYLVMRLAQDQGELLGVLLYLFMNTKPDIACAVGLLSRTLPTCNIMVYLLQYSVGVPLICMCLRMQTGLKIYSRADLRRDTLSLRREDLKRGVLSYRQRVDVLHASECQARIVKVLKVWLSFHNSLLK